MYVEYIGTLLPERKGTRDGGWMLNVEKNSEAEIVAVLGEMEWRW